MLEGGLTPVLKITKPAAASKKTRVIKNGRSAGCSLSFRHIKLHQRLQLQHKQMGECIRSCSL